MSQKTIELLKKCSEFRSHPYNQAKVYALVEDKLYTIGKNCFISETNRVFWIKENNTIISKHDFTILYGISLTNVLTWLKNKKVETLNIIKVSPEESWQKTYYQIFTNFLMNSRYTSHQTIEYSESYGDNFEEFENSNLGQLLFDLYEIN